MYNIIYNRIIIFFNSFLIRFFALLKGSWISFGATIYIHSGGKFEIGRGVRVAQDSVLSVLPGAVLVLKDRCIINHGVTIYCADRVVVGSQSRIAHYCSILDHDYNIHSGNSRFNKPKKTSAIFIGENVWLGAYVIVFKGVSIADHCVIGAQTMVRKSIAEKMVVYCLSNTLLSQSKLP